ncbi:Ion trans, Na trans assoc, and/or PKD channel domain containing protein, partial [Asbolus verrucosus]
MESLKNLKDVLILVILVLSVLATLGLQLYMGVLTQKCVRHFPLDGSWGNLTEENWESFVSSEENWYFDVDRNEYPLCGNSSGAGMCLSDHTCLQGYGQNPNYGYTNFDKFGWALLTSFQLMTQDYWESVYQPVLNSAGPWHILFFIVAIFFISINFLNLILASVTKCYSELLKCNEEEEAERQAVSKRADKDTTTKSAWDCCPTIQKFVALFIFNPFIQLFIVVCIILNTVFMALDHHNMTIDLEKILVYGNYFFVLIFVIETILKIIALNPKCYFQNNWNRLDFIVIALALFALFAANAGGLLGGFIILRIFTLLRLFKLVKFLPTLNFLLSVMSKSLSAVANLTLVTFVTVFIFALLGMHSFGINYIDNYDRFPGYELPRWNFTDLMHSFMLIFRVFCGEWVESMWDELELEDPDNMTNKDKHPPPCFPESCYKKLPKGRINKKSSFWRTWSYLRRKIFDLVESKYFEGAVITIIIFSSLALTLEDIFITMRPQLQNILHHLDAVFIITNTLTQSKSGICSALFLCLLIWLFFAILGVQLFAGKFFKCIDDNYTVASFEIIPDFYSCMFNNFTWENSPMNFDHVGNAYLSLFEVAIFKGWIQIMNDAIDSREIDNQPIREVNIYMYLYFIAFIIFGSFFTMNLFIGVILHNYKEQEAKVRGWLAWNKGTQNRLHNAMNLKASKTPLKAIPKPKWKPQLKVLEMVTNKKFEMVMLVVIGLNILTMATDHYQAKEGFI